MRTGLDEARATLNVYREAVDKEAELVTLSEAEEMIYKAQTQYKTCLISWKSRRRWAAASSRG
jgi:hypothetical protein